MNQHNTNRNFTMMTIAYCLGTFNDNLFKQSALLLMVAAGLTAMQGTATTLFALPFALFASYGGYMADRFPKNRVVVFSKVMELAAMLFGAAGIILGHWNLILVMVVIMSTQSVIFSPALNGAIPENFPPAFVPRANGIIKMTTTCSILLGMGLAGFMLDMFPGVHYMGFALSHILVGLSCILVSVLGIASSLAIKGPKYTKAEIPFPWLGPLESLRICQRLTRDPQLTLAFVCDAFFYGVSANLVMVINALVAGELRGSQTQASLAILSMMLGVALGALYMGKHTNSARWSRPLAPALVGMGLSLCAVYGLKHYAFAAQASLYSLFALLFCAGLAGGIFLLPFTNFIQIRPVNTEKGRIIGTTYFTSFSAVGLLGLVYTHVLAPRFDSLELMLFAGLSCFALSVYVAFTVRRLAHKPQTDAVEILS